MDALLASELSPETLAALQAHLAAVQVKDDDGDVSEDFRLSQFWYDQKTGEALAREALEKSNGGPIAFLSTPAAFKALKALLVSVELEPERKNVYLFEYDHRFGDKYGDAFVFYDYNNPLDVDSKLHHFFDYVLVEPPYLTSQCLRGFAKTMRLISRQVEEIDGKQVLKTPNTFINSGAMHKVMYNELQLVPSGFVPTFESKLSNRLTTYINYKSERFGPCEHEFDDDFHTFVLSKTSSTMVDIEEAMPLPRPCSPRRKLSQAKAKDLEFAKEMEKKNSPQRASLSPDVLRKLHITIPTRAEDKMPSARETSETFVTQVMAKFSK